MRGNFVDTVNTHDFLDEVCGAVHVGAPGRHAHADHRAGATDNEAEPADLQELRGAGVQVIVAEVDALERGKEVG